VAESAGDGLGDHIDFSVVADGSGRGDFESGTTQRGGVGADDQADAYWRGLAGGARVVVDIEDIDPVGGIGCVIVEQPECPVGLLVQVWRAKERGRVSAEIPRTCSGVSRQTGWHLAGGAGNAWDPCCRSGDSGGSPPFCGSTAHPVQAGFAA
jgi:hypothetical protein